MMPKARDVVKDSEGLRTESTSPQHNASISLIDSHKSDPPSTAILVMPSSNSLRRLFPSTYRWSDIIIIGGSAIRAISTSGAEVGDTVVVATVVSSTGIRVGTGVA